MAIHTTDTGGINTSDNVEIENLGANKAKSEFKQLNFGMGGGFMSKKTMGADEVAFAKALSKILTKANDGIGVHIFSRSSFEMLAYANIVITLRMDNIITYSNILLEGTGNCDMTVNTFMETINAQERPYVTTDAIDDELDKVVRGQLQANYPEVKEEDFISMQGIVIPAQVDIEDENLIHEVAVETYNSCLLELGLISGELKDIDLNASLSTVSGFVKLRQLTLTQPNINALGQQTKVDWAVELSSTNKTSQTSPNTVGSETSITTAFGRINFLPEEYSENVIGMPPVIKTGLHPQIVVTNFEQSMPSLGYTLLSLATTAVMARDVNWIKPILSNNETSIDIGVLNKLTNIENSEKGGSAIKVNNVKLSQEERVSLIMKFASLAPVISLDTIAFGENASVLSTFSSAAKGYNAASHEIIETLAEMTNGSFPANFPISEIFASEPLVIPDGTWIDKNGTQRTIDDIDTAYILSVGGTTSRQLAGDYIYSELGMSNNAFIDRVMLLQKLGINAKITGRKMRMTFSHNFIDTMLNAFTSCGLNPRFEDNQIFNRPTGLGFTNGAFDRAGVTNVNAFQPYVVQQGYGGQFGGNHFGMNHNQRR